MVEEAKRLKSVTQNEVQEDEEDIPEEGRERLRAFPVSAQAEGSRFLSLRLQSPRLPIDDEQNWNIKAVFTHQIFPDSYHCGLVDLEVNLHIDPTTWRVTNSEEIYASKTENNEGSALDRMKLQDCVAPLFKYDQVIDANLMKGLPGHVIWRNKEGFALKFCDQLNSTSKLLMSRCLAMSTFYIERASQVDLEDPAWKLLLLVKSNSPQHLDSDFDGPIQNEILVGFTTIYEFRNPIKDTRSFRVCVMLVLPIYQRRRLGEHMLSTVYRKASEDDITEVTVEDPCEAFTKMRRRLELASCMRRGLFFRKEISAYEQMPKLSDDLLLAYKKELRFTDKQLQFCYECAWLDALQRTNEVGEESQRKINFRLAVKRRINKDPGDLILPDKEAYLSNFKEALQNAYLQELRSMAETLEAVRKADLNL